MADSFANLQDEVLLREFSWSQLLDGGAVIGILAADRDRDDPLRFSIRQPLASIPISNDVGIFSRLPPEILRQIIGHMSIKNVLLFRTVNRYVQQTIATMIEFKAVITYALDVVTIAMQTGVADKLTLRQLYQGLITKKCSACPQAGWFFYLLTGNRFCYHCLLNSPKASTVPINAMISFARLSSSELKERVPVLTSLPGDYTVDMRMYSVRREYVSVEGVYNTLEALGHSMPQSTARLRLYDAEGIRCKSTVTMDIYNVRTGRADWPVSCLACIRSPYLAPQADGADLSQDDDIDHDDNTDQDDHDDLDEDDDALEESYGEPDGHGEPYEDDEPDDDDVSDGYGAPSECPEPYEYDEPYEHDEAVEDHHKPVENHKPHVPGLDRLYSREDFLDHVRSCPWARLVWSTPEPKGMGERV